MRIFVAIVFVRSTVSSTDWPLAIKKRLCRICVRVQGSTAVSVRKTKCAWFHSDSRQWRNYCLIREYFTYRHLRGTYTHAERRLNSSCWWFPEAVTASHDDTNSCLGVAPKLLTQARFMLLGNLSLLCYACKARGERDEMYSISLRLRKKSN